MSANLPVGFDSSSNPPFTPVAPFGVFDDLTSLYCDPESPMYDPAICAELQAQTQTTTSTGGGGTLNVTVTNSIGISNNIGDALAQQVQEGIQNGADQANQIAQQTANQVNQTLANGTNAIVQGVNSAFGSIGSFINNVINYVGQHISSLFDYVVQGIGSLASKIGDIVSNAIGPIINAAATAYTDIQNVLNNIVVPIFNTVNSAIQTIAALTTAIENDLHAGLSGILRIPSDIANGLGSLNSAVDRVWQQINEGNRLNTDVTLRDVIQKELGQKVLGLGSAITQTGGVSNLKTTWQHNDFLNEPSIAQAVAQFAGTIEKLFFSVAQTNGNLADTIIQPLLQGKKDAGWVVQSLIDGGLTVFFTLVAALGETIPLAEFLEAFCRHEVPLVKLDPATIVAAWRRGFLTDNLAIDELAYNGLDATRAKVLHDLSNTLLDIDTIVTMFRKGIVTEQDVRDNLEEQGYIPDDATAILANRFREFDLATAIRGWRFGDLSDEQLQAVLTENRVGQNEALAFFATLLDEESQQDVQLRHRFDALTGYGLLIDPTFKTLPQDVQDAAKRDGIDADTALDRWKAQYLVPGIAHWVNLFFRGIRTRGELSAVMDFYKVPKEWQADFIDGGRPLIPFRTIPTMLKAGIINEARASQLLSQHGYDLPSINDLLNYAKRTTSTAATAQAVKTHTESVQVATELHTLGAITDADYSQVLAAHGYDAQAIAAELQLQALKAQINHRKDTAADIVANALNGQITYDQAASQLAQQGFSPGEQQKYLRQLRTTKTSQTKLPSIAELVTMVKNKIITDDIFISTLEKSGYSPDWAQKLWAIHFAVLPTTVTQQTS